MALRRLVKVGALGAVVGSTYVGVKYRPRHSDDIAFHEAQKGEFPTPKTDLEKAAWNFGSNVVIGTVATAIHYGMRWANKVEILDQGKLERLVASDRDGQGLLTVCNHHSCFDDPALVCMMSPLSVCLSSKKMRWGVCTEEQCFFNVYASTFFGLGKAIPIQRGGSIDQAAIAVIIDKLSAGDWVHIFPEGRVWQEGGNPLRDAQHRWCLPSGRCGEPFEKMGPLKWGIGKAIANSEKTPAVVPFFHMGMQNFLRQDRDNNVLSWFPKWRQNITVKVGDPVFVQDILDSYHAKAAERAAARQKRRDERRAKSGAAGASVRAHSSAPPPFDGDKDGAKKASAASAASAASTSSSSSSWPPALNPNHPRLTNVPNSPHLFASDMEPSTVTVREYYQRAFDGVPLENGRRFFPTKMWDNGTKVPCFSEPPLRARPPDHDLLTPEEALEEHRLRQQLYVDLTDRVHTALKALEKDVRAHRRAQGLADVDEQFE